MHVWQLYTSVWPDPDPARTRGSGWTNTKSLVHDNKKHLCDVIEWFHPQMSGTCLSWCQPVSDSRSFHKTMEITSVKALFTQCFWGFPYHGLAVRKEIAQNDYRCSTVIHALPVLPNLFGWILSLPLDTGSVVQTLCHSSRETGDVFTVLLRESE